MELDLETFLVTLDVIVDDLYQSHLTPRMPACGGPPAQMSDAEVLCLGLAAHRRRGVPWQSERGIMRYVRKHLKHLFPTVLTQSAFNRRLRRLWGAFILIQDAVAAQLAHGDYDVRDGFPIPVAYGARSFTPGWLADIARIGKGGNDRYVYGVRMLMVINPHGVATGWALASGNVLVIDKLLDDLRERVIVERELAPEHPTGQAAALFEISPHLMDDLEQAHTEHSCRCAASRAACPGARISR